MIQIPFVNQKVKLISLQGGWNSMLVFIAGSELDISKDGTIHTQIIVDENYSKNQYGPKKTF